MPDEEEYFRNIVRQSKVKCTRSICKGRLGLVIDATGRDKTVISRQLFLSHLVTIVI
ncbi:MAG: hypothetical protein CM15mV25_1250 [uncultured marine virus]|nr:MAG: hypothetical protein CM15mV25_1250 [uncultured marine virus]